MKMSDLMTIISHLLALLWMMIGAKFDIENCS